MVYNDESYIYHHYWWYEDTFYDPNDEQNLAENVKHKGRRYYFIAAMIDVDHSISEEQRATPEQAELVHETLPFLKTERNRQRTNTAYSTARTLSHE